MAFVGRSGRCLPDESHRHSLRSVLVLYAACVASCFQLPVASAQQSELRAGSVYRHRVTSPFQRGETQVRVLLPKPLVAGRRYPVVYVLPVEAQGNRRYGDGLSEIYARRLHEQYDAIFVSMQFSTLPWFADHPDDSEMRQESHLLKSVIPLVESKYPADPTRKSRLLLGFSKSGWGAWSLLLRNPETFGRAVAWDAPLMMQQVGKYGNGPVFGDQQTFENYRLTDLLEKRKESLRGPPRLMLSGAANFASQHSEMVQLLNRLGVPFLNHPQPVENHEWHSGWVAQSVGMLLDPIPVRSVLVSNSDQLRQEIKAAKPGSRIRVKPGVYEVQITSDTLQGTEEAPIVIEAQNPMKRPVIYGRDYCLHLVQPSYVVLRDLDLMGASGNGLNIDDGGSVARPAHHIRLERLSVHDIGPNGNRDTIKLSGLNDFVIRSCQLARWGSSGSGIDMVGCHNGLIDQCRLKHRGADQGSGVQAKGGSSDIVVQRCRFDDAGGRAVNVGGSTGAPYFRPRDARYEARRITIEDCSFTGSMSPICFVGVDGADVQFNTIHNPGRWCFRILQESQGNRFIPCRNGSIRRNLIAYESGRMRTTINVGGGTSPETFRFDENCWVCLDRPGTESRLQFAVQQQRSKLGGQASFIKTSDGDLRLDSKSDTGAFGVRSVTAALPLIESE